MDYDSPNTPAGCRSRWTKPALVVLVVFYLLNQMWWAAVVPLGQSPDESGHMGYVEHLLAHRALPRHDTAMVPPILQRIQFLTVPGIEDLRVATDPADPRRGLHEAELRALMKESPEVAHPPRRNHEAGQPPLAYALAAGALAPFTGESNAMERWQLVRVFNLLVGGIGVVAAWFLGRWLWPRAPDSGGLVMATLVAALPMAAFVRSMASNDSLHMAIASVVFVLCVVWRVPTLGRGLLIGLGVGLALLTKASALALVPLFVVWGLWHARRRSESWVALVAGATLASQIFLWYWLVARQSGAFLYLGFAEITFEPLDQPLPLGRAWAMAVWDTARTIPVGFFGYYGSLDIARPVMSQLLTLWIVVGAAVGFFVSGAGKKPTSTLEDRRWQRAVMLALVPVATMLAMMVVSGAENAQAFGTSTLQGRFLLFVMLPMLVLIVAGWRRLLAGMRLRRNIVAILAIIFLLMNNTDLFWLVAPTYHESMDLLYKSVGVNLPEALKRPGLWKALMGAYLVSVVLMALLIALDRFVPGCSRSDSKS